MKFIKCPRPSEKRRRKSIFLIILFSNFFLIFNLILKGALAMVYVSQPLDTVKVKMQTFPEIYKGMVSCFVTTFKRDGVVRGLYAGNYFVLRISINLHHFLFLNHTFFFCSGTVPAIVANVAENSVLFAGNLNAKLRT